MKSDLLIKRYLAALQHYKWYGIGTLGLILSISAGLSTQFAKSETTYAVQGTLIYQPTNEASKPSPLQKTEASASEQKPALGKENLLTDSLLQATSKTLRSKQLAIAPSSLRNQIQIKPDSEQQNRFLITYQDENAQKATLIVNSFLDAVSEQSLAQKRQQIEDSIKVLEKRKDLLEKNLLIAEEKLREFSKQEKPAIQAAIDGSLVSAITNIQQQQRQLRREIEGIDAEIISLQARLGMTPEQAYIASALSADQTVGSLKTKIGDLESQVQIQRQDLQAKHPEVLALQHQRQVYETQLRQRMAEIIGHSNTIPVQNVAYFNRVSNLDKARQDLANKLVNLKTQRERLSQELSILQRAEPELRQEYRDGTALKLDLEKLTKNVARYREAFEQTEKQLAALDLKKAETKSDWATNISPQVKDITQWWLQQPVILLAGGLLGMLIGTGVILLLDLVQGRILSLEEVQAILQQRVPFLGALPTISKSASKEPIPVLVEADSPYLEGYEMLRSSLQHCLQEQPIKMVIVSSLQNEEGKTVTAYNLAIASARAGKKTLLIEANLRAPSHAQTVGLSLTEGGEAMTTANHFQTESIYSTPGIKGLYVLPNPGTVEQVAALLESEQMEALLKSVREEFDFIVIETATLRYSDALLIEPLTDGLILVTRPGYTLRKSLRVVVEKFFEFRNVKLLGILTNQVNQSIRSASFLSF
ncbi:MAG TPA: hypothetical protein IGS53_17955 [Leptolyngbyaceae cyanobacterium M33_DOE_097]|nr:hypothetical protein [Leptolyngbyaceae cyanobacterium M33_DOE_097]